jgi:hypothetical protein
MAARIPRPDDHRCAGVYGDKYNKREGMAGKPCERMIAADQEFCAAHRELTDRERCIAHLSKNHPKDPGGRCPCRALKGQRICGIHGGKAPQNLLIAERRAAKENLEKQVAKLLAAHGVTPIENPLEELRELAGQAKAYKDTLAEIVGNLTEIRYESKAGGEQLRAEVALLERAIDRFGKFLVQMAQLDIDGGSPRSRRPS